MRNRNEESKNRKDEIEMNIAAEKGEGSITLKVEGRVDTITSPVLQEAILNNFQKTGCLILDFAGVEYVSSAGLRALLIGEKTAKGKGGSMKLIHVASVMSVFEVTGFISILHIE